MKQCWLVIGGTSDQLWIVRYIDEQWLGFWGKWWLEMLVIGDLVIGDPEYGWLIIGEKWWLVLMKSVDYKC